ncbi:MAG TPA: calcium-binding protein, partial [Actinomycetota bacterium]
TVALSVVALGVVGGAALSDSTPDRREPKPAKSPNQEERERERDIEELKDNVRDAQERVRDTQRITVGGKRPEGRDNPIGAQPPPGVEGNTKDDDVPVADPREPPAEPLDGRCGGHEGTVTGTERDDRLRGTQGDDIFVGFGGDDVLIGLGGEDFVCAGPGDDTLTGGAGPDLLISSEGNDTLNGGPDHDHAWFAESPSGVSVDLAAGTAAGEGTDRLLSIESVVGSDLGDTISGNAADNGLYAGAGADVVNGREGDDVIAGSSGDDELRGDEGIDTAGYLTGDPNGGGVHIDLQANRAVGEGVDSLFGFEAARGTFKDDVFTGDAEDNSFVGGTGEDIASGGAGDDYLRGEGADDRLEGGPGADLLDGGDGTDTCLGGEEERSCETSSAVGAAAFLLAAVGLIRRRKRSASPHGARSRRNTQDDGQ